MMEQGRLSFILEAKERLDVMEEALLAAERASDPEAVHDLFRSVHTIKGSAALFRLDDIVHFSHSVENALERVRARHLALSEDLVGLLLECHDYLVQRIGELEADRPDDLALRQKGERLMVRLQAC